VVAVDISVFQGLNDGLVFIIESLALIQNWQALEHEHIAPWNVRAL
jgi:hypothetical protein